MFGVRAPRRICYTKFVVRDPSEFLRELFRAAVAAADPGARLPSCLPPMPSQRVLVLGAGKAAASMARALELAWPGKTTGLVITRRGHSVPLESIEVVEAGHPEPDQAGLDATSRLMDLARSAGPDDLAVCLLSGGGSALTPAPIPPITLADEIALSRALLKSGASIGEMNCVRRHISLIKGGRLAALCYPARVLTLLISDTPGDDPADIASGPTVADPTTCADALAVLANWRIQAPPSVLQVLGEGIGESIKPGDFRLDRSELKFVATPRLALEAAAARARELGVEPYILADDMEGEAREVGKAMAAMARNSALHDEPFRAPCVMLSGGETTVRVIGDGRGGRNVEFALALALALRGLPRVYAIACDTDGIDGVAPNAGAVVDPTTLQRAAQKGLNPHQALARNDAHSFFEMLGDAVVTGPTNTNVNDFRAIYVEAGSTRACANPRIDGA